MLRLNPFSHPVSPVVPPSVTSVVDHERRALLFGMAALGVLGCDRDGGYRYDSGDTGFGTVDTGRPPVTTPTVPTMGFGQPVGLVDGYGAGQGPSLLTAVSGTNTNVSDGINQTTIPGIGNAVAGGVVGVGPRLYGSDGKKVIVDFGEILGADTIINGALQLSDGSYAVATAGMNVGSDAVAAFTNGAVILVNKNGNARRLVEGFYNLTSMAEVGGKLLILDAGSADLKQGAALVVYDLKSGSTRTIGLPKGYYQLHEKLAVSADGLYVYLGTADNTGRVVKFDVERGKVVAEAQTGVNSAGRAFHSSVLLSKDGKYLLVGDFNTGQISMFDANTLQLVQTFDVVGQAIKEKLLAASERGQVTLGKAVMNADGKLSVALYDPTDNTTLFIEVKLA